MDAPDQILIAGVEPLTVKWCPRCKTSKPFSEFCSNKAAKDGLWLYCRPCKAAKWQEGDAKHPGRTREWGRRWQRKRTYGMEWGDYDRMLAEQNGLCKICGKPPTKGKGKILHVDHDHKTGRVRALLCVNCNQMIGHAQEDADILVAGARYIEHWNLKNTG